MCCLYWLMLTFAILLAAEIHLTGTKLGCAEGGCGACTVMVSHQAESKLVHRSVNACLCPLYAIEGMHVVTVEGKLYPPAFPTFHEVLCTCLIIDLPYSKMSCVSSLSLCASRLLCSPPPKCLAGLGNPRKGLHPVQARLAKAHGSQCGFCTPGFVMSMYSLLRSKTEAPTETEIEDNLAGNLWSVVWQCSIALLLWAHWSVMLFNVVASAKSSSPGSHGHAVAALGTVQSWMLSRCLQRLIQLPIQRSP